MRGPQKVEHRFDWRERLRRYFHENSVPTGHRSVPESRPLERSQGLASKRFFGNEDGVSIDESVELE